ncbi:DNA gyrase subunit B [Streptomyces sp. NPDC090080]|uniref:DNA gyrase subunit B n=1 Tax=Streptomyces sp. NPDC090080 TaxID=3365939 RepID=UPI00382EE045
MSEDAVTYEAAHIEVLEGLEAVRRRPGMYVGSSGQRGLHEMVHLVVDRALDEVLTGRATTVDVTLLPDGRVRVADDGPGVPFEAAGGAAGSGLESLLTLLHTGRRPFGRHSVTASRFALGPSVTNALSGRLRAEVYRGGRRWAQDYEHGVAVAPPARHGPTTRTGTTITFRPDDQVFGTARCSFDTLAERFRDIAFLNREVHLSLTDLREAGATRSMRYRFPGGLRDFVAVLTERNAETAGTGIMAFEQEVPRMAGTVEVAMAWSGASGGLVRSYANSSPTPEGGVHVAGFLDGVSEAVGAFARERRLPVPEEPDSGAGRIGARLTAVVSVKLDRPEFRGATGSTLGGPDVRDGVREAVREHSAAWLRERPEPPTALLTGARPVADGQSPAAPA